MNYVDYTNEVVRKYCNLMNSNRLLNFVVFGSGCYVEPQEGFNIIYPEENQDICDFCVEYRVSKQFKQVDLVLMSRVLEHLQVRNVDWYLYNISTIMAKDSYLICVVPDMWAVSKALNSEFYKSKVNKFKTDRLTYELLSEGSNVWWRHSLWTDVNSIKYYLEIEKLFTVREINKIRLDTGLVPEEIEVVAVRN